MNVLKNKTRSGSLALFCLMAAALPSQATTLLDYNFNANSATQSSTGTYTDSLSIEPSGVIGADGSGVSGLSGDRAFDNSASDAMGGNGTTGFSGVATNSTTSIGSLGSLTITGWFKADQILGGTAYLLNTEEFSIRAGTDNTTGTLQLKVGGSNAARSTSVSSNTYYDEVDTWVFFAVTWDGSDVRYFDATTSVDVGLVGNSSAFSPTMGTVSTAGLNIGNVSGSVPNPSAARVFDGAMDNVRVFDSALSLSELQRIRSADLSNTAIPEVGSLALVLSFASIAFCIGTRRRKCS